MYLLSHPASGWFYIGSSNDIGRRVYEHGRDLRAGNHLCISLQLAFDSCPEIDVSYTLTATREEAFDLEDRLLSYYRTDCFLANNEISVRYRSEQTRSKISRTLMGHTVNETTREAVGNASRGNTYWVGRKHTDASRERMSQAQLGNQNAKGWRPTAGQIAKRLESMKGFRHSQETKDMISMSNPNNKAVSVGGVQYRSYTAAGQALGVSADTVRRRCLSKASIHAAYVAIE